MLARKIFTAALLTIWGTMAASAQEVTIGVSMGATGSGASLGVHYKNAFHFFPKTLGGHPARYIMLEDATDATAAAQNARKLISESKVDALMGSVSVPSTTQMAVIANESKTPLVALAPVALPPDKREWVFGGTQPIPLLLGIVVDHMKAQGVKTVAYIGFADSWGDIVLSALKQHAGPAGIAIVTDERYARADTSVTGQVIKVLSAKPDAVMVGASGTGAALPHVALVERGFKGQIYQAPAAANKEFIRIGGKAVQGAIASTGPVVVADDLPDSNPIKAVAKDFNSKYEAEFGAGTRNIFSGYSYDGFLMLDAAVAAAVVKAKPGTPEFRAALRDSLENIKDVVGTHGIYNTSPGDHTGLDERARVLIRVENGAWRLLK